MSGRYWDGCRAAPVRLIGPQRMCRTLFCAPPTTTRQPRPEQRDDTCAPSLNHLVGVAQDSGWHIQAERSGSLEIDYQLKFGGLFDR